MLNPIARIVANKQLLTTAGITTAAFLVALPIGAALMPKNQVEAQSPVTTVTRTVSDLGSCTTGTGSSTSTKAVTTAVKTSTSTNTNTTTGTTTQTSSNNSGSTAQVGGNGVAAAVTVGDVLSNNNVPVLSNNNVSVPVLSNNTTTVAPVTTVAPSVNLLNNTSILGGASKSSLLGIGILGL